MGEKPIPVKIAPWGASGKPLDYNDILPPRKSKLVKRAIQGKFDPLIFGHACRARFAQTWLLLDRPESAPLCRV